ncbi:DENN domain-containing protein [Phytophthora infestans]|uniref:DENN (AEX-3) domain-containing protein n=1 Tax=Phytophthora infestans TaxID=4787 RepID=A0A833SXR4_PHYIN|nr:DENN domain-containing protein [Phytophthora infestans]KAF4142686.1 DENN (AEX-3) domain-containing protein [Phytophthora infestans]
MADATCADVPSVEKTWSASTLQSFSEASVQPLQNLGSVTDDFRSVTISSSKLELELQQRNEVPRHGNDAATITPHQSSTSVTIGPPTRSGSWHSSSPRNTIPTRNSNSTLSALSAAAASLKGKTHQVARQHKRALSAFQQKGGLVSWLHGEMGEPSATSDQKHLTTSDESHFVVDSELCTPPSPRSPIDATKTHVAVGRRRSVPNIESNSLFDNFFEKVAAATTSTPSSPHATVNQLRAAAITNDSKGNFEAFTSPESGRQRAATTDLPPRTNAIVASNGSISKAHSAASLSQVPLPETRFSLDEVLSDEWSCLVLWTHLYSSSVGRHQQHHQRLSFLIETTFRITPLYQNLHVVANESTDKEIDFKKLVARLKRLHPRFVSLNGVNNGVPVASPAASRAKAQLSIAIQTLLDQKVLNSEMTAGTHVEKAISALLQLAREVEREFRVLGTKSYVNFADSVVYRNFFANRSGPGNIETLLRAARIPFYQQPKAANPHSLELLRAQHDEDPVTLFARAECQVFVITALPDNSIKLTDISPHTSNATAQQVSFQTIQPFLNPSNAHPEASRSLAFNFIAGSGSSAVHGAVMWLPAEQSSALGTQDLPSGLCVISKFPLVDSMRHFLSALWRDIRSNTEVTDHCDQVMKAAIAMGNHFPSQSIDELPSLDFKLDDLFDSLSLTNVLRLFAFVLLEKKIILVASSYTVLFCASEALRALLHPLVWSHVYVPVLPLPLKDCLHCPTPFIFGLHESYVRRSDMPRPSNDLVVVNLDRDSLTGGGDVFLPPVRQSTMREELFRLCKPHFASRDSVDRFDSGKRTLPTAAIRRVFDKHVREILASLEPCVNRLEFSGQNVAVVDNDNSSLWPADTVRFCPALLHTQAMSTHLASPRSDEIEKS